MRKGALGALGARLGFFRETLTLGLREAEIPLKVDDMGRYILSVEDFGGRRGRRRRRRDHSFSASMVVWAGSRKRPNFANGGIR